MYNIKNGLDYQKKRAKRKDTSDEKFLTAVVNFLIMALIVFCIVKAMNAAGERFGHIFFFFFLKAVACMDTPRLLMTCEIWLSIVAGTLFIG